MNVDSSIGQLKPFFRFPVENRQAQSRFIAGAALLLAGFIVPIVPGIIVYGYALRVLRSTAEGEVPAMPAWHDWSWFLSFGARGTLINVIFTLPGAIVSLVGLAAYFGMIFALPLSSTHGGGSGDLAVGLVFAAMAIQFVTMAVSLVLLLLAAIPLPVSVSHFVVKDRFSAAFRLREWWPILAANRLGYFIAFVVTAGIIGISSLATLPMFYTFVLTCVAYLLIVPIGFYMMLVGAALFGEAYREGAALSQGESAA